jgi:hypothetical protein
MIDDEPFEEILFSIEKYADKLFSKPIFKAPSDLCPLSKACRTGDIRTVRELLTSGEANARVNDDEPLRMAARSGHFDIVELLLTHTSTFPGTRNNEALRIAVRRGHVEVVDLLLDEIGCDASVNDNELIRMAVRNGQPEIVQLLLEKFEVDPTANDNEAIRTVVRDGNQEILRLLLGSEKCDPNVALLEACKCGNDDVVKFLLDLGVDPSANNFQAFVKAVDANHYPIIQMFIDHPAVDPGMWENDLIRHAAKCNDLVLLRMLVKKGDRVNPGDHQSVALVAAVSHRNIEMVRLLLGTGKVDPHAQNSLSLRLTFENKHVPRMGQIRGMLVGYLRFSLLSARALNNRSCYDYICFFNVELFCHPG